MDFERLILKGVCIMKVKLSIEDRILLVQVLLGLRDNYAMLKSVREFVENLSFTEVEKKLYGIKVVQTATSWQKSFDLLFDVPTSVFERIKITFTEKNKRNDLDMKLIYLYEKFCEQKPDTPTKKARK